MFSWGLTWKELWQDRISRCTGCVEAFFPHAGSGAGLRACMPAQSRLETLSHAARKPATVLHLLLIDHQKMLLLMLLCTLPRGLGPAAPLRCSLVRIAPKGSCMLHPCAALWCALRPATLTCCVLARLLGVPRLGLARVSILRGEGPRLGTPCIDDYVRAVEPVFDHLTRYRWVSALQVGLSTTGGSQHYRWVSALQVDLSTTDGSQHFRWVSALQVGLSTSGGSQLYRWV